MEVKNGCDVCGAGRGGCDVGGAVFACEWVCLVCAVGADWIGGHVVRAAIYIRFLASVVRWQERMGA